MSLTKEAVVEKMKQSHAVVLSVLPEVSFEKLRIRGSRNVPWGGDTGAFVQSVEEKFGVERFLIEYGLGPSDPAAAQAVEALRERGLLAEVYPEGLQDWSDAGFPVAGTDLLVRTDFN